MSRPFLIASYVPSPLRQPLRVALGEEHRIVEAVGWPDLIDLVRRRPVDLIVVDPAVEGAVETTPIMRVMDSFPRTPLLVYTSLGPASAGALTELSIRGVKDVVLARYDDSPKKFNQLLERVAKKQLSRYVISNIADSLGMLPEPVAKAVEQMFDKPQAFLSASDIATAAGVPLSSLYRSLRLAGFRSAKRILVAARVLRAHAYMREPGYSVQEVASKLGYSHPRILARHTNLALGVKPRHLRRRMSDEAVIGRLVDWMYDNDATD